MLCSYMAPSAQCYVAPGVFYRTPAPSKGGKCNEPRPDFFDLRGVYTLCDTYPPPPPWNPPAWTWDL